MSSSFTKIPKHLHGDLPAHHPHEHDQPGHQLHQRGGQVQPGLHHQHHLHDGPRLCLPLSVGQSPTNLGHQAGGDMADIQLREGLQKQKSGIFQFGNSTLFFLDFF